MSNADFWKGEIPWFSPKDMKSFDLRFSQDHIGENAITQSATRLVKPGTILVVGRSGILAHTFPVGIVRQPSAFNQDIRAIVPSSSFEPDFVALYLKAKQTLILKEGVKRGPTVHSLRADFLENIEIPVLSLDQQRQVANVLSCELAEVEKARNAAAAQLQEAAILKSQAIESVFTSVPICKKIGTVAKVQSGYAFRSETFQTKGIRLLRNTNILPGKVYWDDSVYLSEAGAKSFPSYELYEGDVLISLDRPIISSGIKVARVRPDDLPALLLQRVGRFLIDPEQLHADYLYAYLQTQMFISAISGHDQSLGVPHISPTQVEEVEMPLPEISVQRDLSKRLNSIMHEWEVIQTAIQAQLDDTSALPQAILAQAFNN